MNENLSNTGETNAGVDNEQTSNVDGENGLTLAPNDTTTVTEVPGPTDPAAKVNADTLGIIAICVGGLLFVAALTALIYKVVIPKLFGPKKYKGALDITPTTENVVVEQESDGAGGYISIGCHQTIGARTDQEDSYCVGDRNDARTKGFMACVCDGIGGLASGEVASGLAVGSALATYQGINESISSSQRLLEMVAAAQRAVLNNNRRTRQNCGCTFTGVIIRGCDMNMISVGDSRIALYRAGVLMALNREHVLARRNSESMALKRSGRVLNARQGGALISFIGKDDLELVDRTLHPIRVVSGDRVLLMSDGVFGTLSDDEIISYLELPAQKAAESIIAAVEQKGKRGQDNATVVVIQID